MLCHEANDENSVMGNHNVVSAPLINSADYMLFGGCKGGANMELPEGQVGLRDLGRSVCSFL